MSTDRDKSKFEKFAADYFEGASEGAAYWGLGGIVIGAGYGAFLGWTLLPPETVNFIQLLVAIVGLVIGACVGAVAGFIAGHLFSLAIVFLILYGLASWLFSS